MFEPETKGKMDPAITFVDDSDRFCDFELQQMSKEAPEGQGTSRGHFAVQSTQPLAQLRTPTGKALLGNKSTISTPLRS